ncbi:MAG TPA: hypothetical protein VK094_05105 [Pseudogracilibacillus sp.]|nr:hypothetical protein [Pseudogracilibacillus sp.]
MNKKFKNSIKFAVYIAVITFVLAAIFSIVSSSSLSRVSWIFGLIIVLIIVVVGILFDMLGVAATAADEVPFNAMAAEKVMGAKEAVTITKNADKFSSFCNDVIGDITGIISGSALTIVIIEIASIANIQEESIIQISLSVFLTSIIAALTVGGKAVGKYFAINSSTEIVIIAGKFIYILESKLKIKVF